MSKKLLSQVIKLSFAFLSLASASGINNAAQAQETPPAIFGDIKIERPLTKEPLTVRGISGGKVPGKDITERKETPTCA
mgnify:CR=1 FL=1